MAVARYLVDKSALARLHEPLVLDALGPLLVAATAHRHRLAVLHYDADFNLIAEMTGLATRWVVPRGSLRSPSGRGDAADRRRGPAADRPG